MRHSNQVRELLISDKGVALADVYSTSDGVLIGSAKLAENRRRAREERDLAAEAARSERLLELKRETLEAKISALRAEYAAHEEQVARELQSAREAAEAIRVDRDSLSQLRTETGNRASNGGRA